MLFCLNKNHDQRRDDHEDQKQGKSTDVRGDKRNQDIENHACDQPYPPRHGWFTGRLRHVCLLITCSGQGYTITFRPNIKAKQAFVNGSSLLCASASLDYNPLNSPDSLSVATDAMSATLSGH